MFFRSKNFSYLRSCDDVASNHQSDPNDGLNFKIDKNLDRDLKKKKLSQVNYFKFLTWQTI